MSIFDKRDHDFENKFAHDEELAFKAIARRNKLLGLWAAIKLGKTGADAEEYARNLAVSAVEGADIAQKLLKELAAKNVTAKDIHTEMERLLPVARKQVMEE